MNNAQAKRLRELIDDFAYACKSEGFDEGRADMNSDTRMGDYFDADLKRHARKVETRRKRVIAYIESLTA